ncbi:hypothetical protein ACFL35_17535, partial [Candidatus Riflebacteria bacterium]
KLPEKWEQVLKKWAKALNLDRARLDKLCNSIGRSMKLGTLKIHKESLMRLSNKQASGTVQASAAVLLKKPGAVYKSAQSGDKPGKAGISRGPGDAALKFSQQKASITGLDAKKKIKLQIHSLKEIRGRSLGIGTEELNVESADLIKENFPVMLKQREKSWKSRISPRYHKVLKTYFQERSEKNGVQ